MFDLDPDVEDGFVCIEDGRVASKGSTAACRVMAHLPYPWRCAGVVLARNM